MQLRLDFGDAQRFRHLLALFGLQARDTWDAYRALRYAEQTPDVAWMVSYYERVFRCRPQSGSRIDDTTEEDTGLWTTPDTHVPGRHGMPGNGDQGTTPLTAAGRVADLWTPQPSDRK